MMNSYLVIDDGLKQWMKALRMKYLLVQQIADFSNDHINFNRNKRGVYLLTAKSISSAHKLSMASARHSVSP